MNFQQERNGISSERFGIVFLQNIFDNIEIEPGSDQQKRKRRRRIFGRGSKLVKIRLYTSCSIIFPVCKGKKTTLPAALNEVCRMFVRPACFFIVKALSTNKFEPCRLVFIYNVCITIWVCACVRQHECVRLGSRSNDIRTTID